MNQLKPLEHMKADPKDAICKNPPNGDDFRNIFQRDRDRIMYSKAFRRLAGKTQVFFAGHDDHLRTRLTHTLEVSQIARTISSKLGLDLDLTEAIALGHDIGHAPFGHVGERVLNYFSNGCELYKGFNYREKTDSIVDNGVETLPIEFMGYKHNWQSVRIAVNLTRHRGELGLDLSRNTIFGILYHTALSYGKCPHRSAGYCKLRERSKERKCGDPILHLDYYTNNYGEYQDLRYYSVESLVVALSDEIAQRHHDIEDGIRANLISEEELKLKLKDFIKLDAPEIHEKKHVCSNDKEDFITILSGLFVHSYVKKTINYLTEQLGERKYKNIRELIQSPDLDTVMKNIDIYKVVEGDEQLHRFLKERMLSSHIAQVMDGRADFLIRRLFKAYISNPQQLPDNTIRIMMKTYRDYRQSKGYGNVAYSNVDFDEIPIGEIRKHLAKLQTRGRFSFRAIMLRTICDYISGMTDRRAISEYQNLYGIHN